MPTTAARATLERTAASYSFRLELSDQDQRLLHSLPLTAAAFRHALHATHFEAFRQGALPSYDPASQDARIEPVFAEQSASDPRCNGFRIELATAASATFTQAFTLNYFAAAARQARQRLVRENRLPAEQAIHYQLAAYWEEPVRSPQSPAVELSLGPPRSLAPIRAAERLDLGPAEAWDHCEPGQLPILVERAVLEEGLDEARSAPHREVGGVLLGHVSRDPVSGEVFVQVTCLASGEGTTESGPSNVTLTPATFARAQELIELRGLGEVIVGWYHSHPFRFCDACPLPTPPECINKVLFYSDEDLHLMETTFEQPYMMGLLLAVEPKLEAALGHLPVRLFGWNQGTIQARGFEVVDR
jgi:proteasome lid subunit RPN8/RPN11